MKEKLRVLLANLRFGVRPESIDPYSRCHSRSFNPICDSFHATFQIGALLVVASNRIPPRIDLHQIGGWIEFLDEVAIVMDILGREFLSEVVPRCPPLKVI